jgi:hypothetical protein
MRKQRSKLYTIAVSLIIVALIAAGFAFPKRTYACSCAVQPDPEMVLQQSAAVFTGKAVKIKREVLQDNGIYIEKKAVLFQVNRSWMGPSAEQLIVRTNAGGGSDCGFDFRAGTSYLVYAYEANHGLETSICSLTKEQAAAENELITLGPGNPPKEKNQLEARMDNMELQNTLTYGQGLVVRIWNRYRIAAACASFMLLAAAAAWFVRRRRSKRP